MKNRRHIPGALAAALVIATVAALGAAAAARAAGDHDAGKIKAIPCMGCHAIPGYSNVYPTYHVPRVGGQHAEYLVAALKAYRAKERSHPTMRAQASTLSDQDIEDIAAFFSSTRH